MKGKDKLKDNEKGMNEKEKDDEVRESVSEEILIDKPNKPTKTLPYPSRMTLELANCSLCVPKGIARDVLVPVGRLTFPADFVVVDFECDYRVPLIFGRPFLRTARVLIDVHGEELVIRDEFDSLVGEIIKQKEEVKKISDLVARRRACFTSNLKNFRIIHQGRVIHSPQIVREEFDKEDLIPIPRESKIGKECDFPLCDDFQSFKTFSILDEEIEEFLKHDESLNMDLNDEFSDEEGDINYLEKLLEDFK
ncbi:reverse transcriptase domain-containing protein [Tanacetum coccineum]